LYLTDIYQKIRGSEADRAAIIKSIFNDKDLKSGVIKFVLRNNGSQDDAELIFDDMIVQFVKTVFSKPDFQISGELNAYLMGIARHLWFAQLRHKKMYSHSDPLDDLNNAADSEEPESLYLTSERQKVLHELLDKLRGNCRDVLMHWANGFSMEEIAAKLNYQSEGMARKKKSVCLKELLLYIQNNPHIKAILV
jgi:RNA polymerase sigma factor (sigma-70 family)